jgi:hypothetical protein
MSSLATSGLAPVVQVARKYAGQPTCGCDEASTIGRTPAITVPMSIFRKEHRPHLKDVQHKYRLESLRATQATAYRE